MATAILIEDQLEIPAIRHLTDFRAGPPQTLSPRRVGSTS